jgi:hypothetical protein
MGVPLRAPALAGNTLQVRRSAAFTRHPGWSKPFTAFSTRESAGF